MVFFMSEMTEKICKTTFQENIQLDFHDCIVYLYVRVQKTQNLGYIYQLYTYKLQPQKCCVSGYRKYNTTKESITMQHAFGWRKCPIINVFDEN